MPDDGPPLEVLAAAVIARLPRTQQASHSGRIQAVHRELARRTGRTASGRGSGWRRPPAGEETGEREVEGEDDNPETRKPDQAAARGGHGHGG